MSNRRNYQMAIAKTLSVPACMLLSLACGIHKSTIAFREGRYEVALAEYSKELRANPKNLKALAGVRRTAPLAAEQHLAKAKEASSYGRNNEVLREVGMALVLDPTNTKANDWLEKIEKEEEERRKIAEATTSIDNMRLKMRREANGEPPNINPRSLEGIDLNFVHKTSLKEIFRHLSKNSGVNIVLHHSVRDDINISIDLRGLTFQQIIDVLALQNDLFYKVIDTNSLMFFKKSPAASKEHERNLVQTFYLSNADIDSVKAAISALIQDSKTISVDKRLNAIIVMGKTNDIEIAKRVVDQLDKTKAEVNIYLELIEITENSGLNAGLMPIAHVDTGNPKNSDLTPMYAMGAALSTKGTGAKLALGSIGYLLPSLKLDLAKTNGDVRILANPNIRVISLEKGEINIGDKIGYVKSTFSKAKEGNDITGIEKSYDHAQVGVNIKVEPIVHINNEITIKLEAEITTWRKGVVSSDQLDFGMRKINTTVRLRDGEQVMFAGFLKEEEQKSLRKILGLSDVPVLGGLFNHHDKAKQKIDVVLSIRAELVRKPDLQVNDFKLYDLDKAVCNKPFDPEIDNKESDNTANTDRGSDNLKSNGLHDNNKQVVASKLLPASTKTEPAVNDNSLRMGFPDLGTTTN